MMIIDKDDLDKYRFAVAKVSFLKIYGNYELVDDIYKSNCFILFDNLKKQKVIISLLWKPTIDVKKYELPIIIYYQKNYKRNDNRMYETLSEDFNNLFSADLNKAIYSASLYYQENERFNKIIYDILYDATVAKDTTGLLCKYYSETIFTTDTYNKIDGVVSFLNPRFFNDPFDCNCMNYYHKSISDMFRVLCTTSDYQNILMWSYYCNDHKGYCLQYRKHDIISAILSLKINGLCIIGNVDYKDKRPSYIAKGTASYSDLKFWIDCTFTKYEKWNHEKEYRFVILSNDFNDGGSATSVSIPVVNYYSGCKCDATKLILSDSKGAKHSTMQLKMDSADYKLN